MSLRDRTIRGVSWTFGGTVAGQVLSFAITAVLARLLQPADFGLMAMTVAWLGVLNHLNELGFRTALVQRKDLDAAHASSAFWFTAAVGVGWAVAGILLAPLVGGFFGEPRVTGLFRAMSLTFALSGVTVVQTALLTREMRFRQLAGINLAALAASGAVGITLARAGVGAWSLAAQALTLAAVTASATWVAARWRPRAQFTWHAVGDLVRVGRHVVGFDLFNYFVRNGDNILIGRVIGSFALGLYTRAYATMLLPLTAVSGPFASTMLPALSSIQDEPARIRRTYLRTIAAIALVTCPMMVGLLVVADAFVMTIYGQQWRPIVPVLRVLCVLGFAQSIGTTAGWIFVATGRTDRMFRFGVVASLILIASIVVGILFGTILSVAVCYAIAGVLVEAPALWLSGRLIGMTLMDVWRALRGIAAASLGMGALLWAVSRAIPADWPAWGRLAAQVPLGVAVYAALVALLRLNAYVDVRRVMVERYRGAAQPA
jgi:O-antigen/teichoic acid export membrane protein